MNWAVTLKESARRELRQLDKELREDALSIFLELTEQGPAIHGAIELRNNPDVWRVRLGASNRIVYRVHAGKHTIRVIRIRCRSVVYRGFR
jgi:mRNA-degrading endonuclease RelE of RelBE toxin-antitoxin system